MERKMCKPLACTLGVWQGMNPARLCPRIVSPGSVDRYNLVRDAQEIVTISSQPVDTQTGF
jgi:hypothetical protein